jgi:hypothetical protein
MKTLTNFAAGTVIFLFIATAVCPSALAQSHRGAAVAVQLDGLFLYRGTMEPSGQLSSSTFSPFVGLEIRLFRPVSLRVGVSPPTGQQPGTQAFATYLALQAWLGRGPHFLEIGIGSYYQNTWCNGVPDYRAYTASLGWRFVADRMVFRFGGILGVTPGGKLAAGLTFGLGRAI